MTTKIRQIRKLRGFTLQNLADRVGTTPQTIQRLETNKMTVSIEWLERIGLALGQSAASLLTSYAAPGIRLVGDLDASGTVKPIRGQAARIIAVSVPGDDPMAVKIATRFGPHEAGTILIASRLADSRRADADGRDCLIELVGGKLLYRRIVHAKGGTTAYVPYDDQSGVERNLDIAWLAPVVMTVRYLSAQAG
jgi:transcriptional regulator with XRE-family HTH domain